MHRTNIYLDDHQASALNDAARAQGISRAELVRRLIDQGLRGDGPDDPSMDLAAIDASFGILADDDSISIERGPDERSRHLEQIGRP